MDARKIQSAIEQKHKSLGLTYKQVSEVCGVPISTLHGYNIMTLISLENTVAYADAVGLEIIIRKK